MLVSLWVAHCMLGAQCTWRHQAWLWIAAIGCSCKVCCACLRHAQARRMHSCEVAAHACASTHAQARCSSACEQRRQNVQEHNAPVVDDQFCQVRAEAQGPVVLGVGCGAERERVQYTQLWQARSEGIEIEIRCTVIYFEAGQLRDIIQLAGEAGAERPQVAQRLVGYTRRAFSQWKPPISSALHA
jgi:hypothetical protein